MTHISFAPRIALAAALLAAVLALTADAAHAITLCHEGFKIS